jgi:hypothetical protein
MNDKFILFKFNICGLRNVDLGFRNVRNIESFGYLKYKPVETTQGFDRLVDDNQLIINDLMILECGFRISECHNYRKFFS